MKIYRLIENRRKGLWMAGLILAPFLLVGLVVFAILQGQVLGNGILDETWILGSPRIVTLWLIVSSLTVLILARHLTTFLAPAPAARAAVAQK